MLGWLRALQSTFSRNSVGDPDEFRLSLIEHLDELRTRIIRSAYVLVALWAAIALTGQDFKLVHLMVERFKSQIPKTVNVQVMMLHLTDGFMLHMRLSFQLAILIAAPFLVLQIWGFVAPGLKPKERKPLQTVAPFTICLFALGVFFCWQILPTAASWFVGYVPDFGMDVQQSQNLTMLVNFNMMMLLAFGLGFQLPILMWILSKIGIVTPAVIRKSWRHMTVGIFVAAMVFTPSNDVFSMLMMAIPLTIMFAITALIILWNGRNAPRDPLLDDLD